ncbi:hypothetical protein HYZ98_02120 [Candidatus Peregrinibacteria bacterium]|nr:hypothetical protein [Candidatus Peregrinibacteria bacterium]
MFSATFNTMFGFIGVFYGVLLPLVLLQFLALLLIPTLLHHKGDAIEVGKAIYCLLLEGLGLILLTAGGIPTVYSVLSGSLLQDRQYLALLLIFAAGGLLFLWHDHLMHSVDKSVRALPQAILFFAVRLVGIGAIVFSILSLVLSVILHQETLEQNWWVLHTIVFIYGAFLWWCTSFDHLGKDLFKAGPFGFAGKASRSAKLSNTLLSVIRKKR